MKKNEGKSKPYGYIYQIKNKKNGKVYIGQTITARWRENQNPIEERWRRHQMDPAYKREQGQTLHYIENAILNDGPENFEIKEIDTAESQKELDDKEKHWISYFDSMNPEIGYNLREGGADGLFSDEAKGNVSKAITEKWQNPEYRAKQTEERRTRGKEQEWKNNMTKINREKGKDPNWVQKMTEINQERAKDPEWREKMSEVMKEKWQDPEYQDKQAKERKERAKDPEWVQKMTEINQERAKDPSYREKLSEAGKQKWQDPEYKEKISNAMKNKWQDQDYREKQMKARRECTKKIQDIEQFLKDIQEMNKKKEINEKYEMDGKTINRRIEDLLGQYGVKNYTDARSYLEGKDVKEILNQIKGESNETGKKQEESSIDEITKENKDKNKSNNDGMKEIEKEEPTDLESDLKNLNLKTEENSKDFDYLKNESSEDKEPTENYGLENKKESQENQNQFKNVAESPIGEESEDLDIFNDSDKKDEELDEKSEIDDLRHENFGSGF